jgi:hypothetical protein
MHKGGNQYELDISSYGETEKLWNMIIGKPLVSNHLEDQDKIGDNIKKGFKETDQFIWLRTGSGGRIW